MYILKIKGTAGIPDFIQIREDDFTLASYFRLENLSKSINENMLSIEKQELVSLIERIPFGELFRV